MMGISPVVQEPYDVQFGASESLSARSPHRNSGQSYTSPYEHRLTGSTSPDNTGDSSPTSLSCNTGHDSTIPIRAQHRWSDARAGNRYIESVILAPSVEDLTATTVEADNGIPMSPTASVVSHARSGDERLYVFKQISFNEVALTSIGSTDLQFVFALSMNCFAPSLYTTTIRRTTKTGAEEFVAEFQSTAVSDPIKITFNGERMDFSKVFASGRAGGSYLPPIWKWMSPFAQPTFELIWYTDDSYKKSNCYERHDTMHKHLLAELVHAEAQPMSLSDPPINAFLNITHHGINLRIFDDLVLSAFFVERKHTQDELGRHNEHRQPKSANGLFRGSKKRTNTTGNVDGLR